MSALKNQDQGTIVLSQQDYLPILIESFLIDRRSQGLSPATIGFYKKKLNYFLAYCEGHAGREYLSRRSLSRAVWEAWHLGFSMAWDPKLKHNRPAISIPWLDMDGKSDVITSVKYRFVDNDPEGLRYISLPGSIPLLFGLWDVIRSDTTLVLIEGEMNALSIWQCLPRGVSVLSFGSEAGGRADILKPLALRYRRVFVWADNPRKAGEMREALEAAATTLQSPLQDGVKWDANKMLQEGVLPEFISQLLGTHCLGWIATASD